MATEKWVAGVVGLTWANAFTGSTLNSIASGNAIQSDLNLDNSSNLDMFMDISIVLASAAFIAPNYIGVYVHPLNEDGSTYGDGRFGSSAAGPPSACYYVGKVDLVAATQAQEGTLRGVLMPPGQFKIVLHNQGGVALASSGNVCKYRTYNRSVA